jgi:hypothetical protein
MLHASLSAFLASVLILLAGANVVGYRTGIGPVHLGRVR